jgi:hypothetical protein
VEDDPQRFIQCRARGTHLRGRQWQQLPLRRREVDTGARAPSFAEGGARADRDTPAAGTGHALAPGCTCTQLSAARKSPRRPCGAHALVTSPKKLT